MRKLTNRQKKAKDTFSKIRKTAIRLFNKKGFDQITVDKICQEAGVCKGTFYLYFKSKEQVVLDLFKDTDKMYEDYFSKELASINDSVEKILRLGKKALEYEKDRGVDVVQITYRSRINVNQNNRPQPIENRYLYKIIVLLIEKAQAQKQLRDEFGAEDIARIIMQSVDGLILAWCLSDGKFDLLGEGEKLFSVLRAGLLKIKS